MSEKKTTTKAKKQTKEKAPVKKLTPDAKGNYPFQLYSVRAKDFVDVATNPKATVKATGRGAFMCKGFDSEGNSVATIISTTVAQNWLTRGLVEEAEEGA